MAKGMKHLMVYWTKRSYQGWRFIDCRFRSCGEMDTIGTVGGYRSGHGVGTVARLRG